MTTHNIHGLPDLPPHHRFVTKGTPWHDRMLWCSPITKAWGSTGPSLGYGLEPKTLYCEPAYPPIPEGYELYEGEWVEGVKYAEAWVWHTIYTESDYANNMPHKEFACIRPIPKKQEEKYHCVMYTPIFNKTYYLTQPQLQELCNFADKLSSTNP